MNTEFNQVFGEVKIGQRKIQDLPKEQRTPVAVAILNDAAKHEGGVLASGFRRAISLGEDFAVNLASGKLKLAESTKVFIAKNVAAGTKLSFVESGDVEKQGVRDIAYAGLPANKPYFLRAIRLRQATSSGTVAEGIDTTKSEAAGLDFDYVDKILSTGSLTIKVGDKEIVSRLSCSMFNNKGNTTVNPGYYELANPVWIEDQKVVEIYIDKVATLPAKTFAWLDLIGLDTYNK